MKMNYGKLGNFITISSVISLISEILYMFTSLFMQSWIIQLVLEQYHLNFRSYSIVYLILFIFFSVIGIGNSILLMVGFAMFNKQNRGTDKQIKTLFILRIMQLALSLISIIQTIFLTPYIYDWVQNGFLFDIVIRLIAFLFMIPDLIYVIIYFLWGRKLHQKNSQFDQNGFYIIIICQFLSIGFLFFVHLLRYILIVLFEHSGYIWMMYIEIVLFGLISIGLSIGMLMTGLQLQKTPQFEKIDGIDLYCPECNYLQKNNEVKYCQNCGTLLK